MTDDYFKYRDYMQAVADEDVRFTRAKDESYGGSWKRAGGRSAWFMLRRKMDRLIELLKPPSPPVGWPTTATVTAETVDRLLRMTQAEDVFAAVTARPGGEDGTVLAEVRDLRRYLLLVEAEMVARGVVEVPAKAPPRPSLLEGGKPVASLTARDITPGKHRSVLSFAQMFLHQIAEKLKLPPADVCDGTSGLLVRLERNVSVDTHGTYRADVTMQASIFYRPRVFDPPDDENLHARQPEAEEGEAD